MAWMLTVLTTVFVVYLIGFWSTRSFPALRPYRFNQSSDVQLPEARQTTLHTTFASRNGLNAVVASALSDADRIEALLAWAHALWTPLPGRHANSSNPQTIVSRALNGERFSRSDINTVLAHAMMAVDIPTRLVTLKTRDCTWRPLASHYVGIEYFDRDHFKWVWLDGSYGVRLLDEFQPLSALDIKNALLDQKLLMASPDRPNIDVDEYLEGLSPYLDIVVAQPIGQTRTYALVPPQLKLHRRKWLIGPRQYDVSCHSAQAFYASHPVHQLTHPERTRAIPLQRVRTVSGQAVR